MAVNFRIRRHRKKNEVHLSLTGDFDGSSAMELLEALREHTGNAEKIYVHTDCLSAMEPFGENVLKKRVRFSGNFSGNLVFTGLYSSRMIPETSYFQDTR